MCVSNPTSCSVQYIYFFFYVHETVHRTFMSINVQQDATIHSLFYLQTATDDGWFLHPSSVAQITVSTASGTSQPLLLPVAIVEVRLQSATGSNNG